MTLVRVFAHRNEPVEIPYSMGACMVKGYIYLAIDTTFSCGVKS